MTDPTPSALLDEVRRLIDSARERAAVAINAELTLLYWQVGHRVHVEVLRGSRAEYGQQVIRSLARQLKEAYGRGWSDKQLRHCVRLAEVFPDEASVSAVRRELSRTHLKTLIDIDDPAKRDFYIELARVERWSTRQLQERIDSMLFERSAISRKPEDAIRRDLTMLRDGDGCLLPRC